MSLFFYASFLLFSYLFLYNINFFLAFFVVRMCKCTQWHLFINIFFLKRKMFFCQTVLFFTIFFWVSFFLLLLFYSLFLLVCADFVVYAAFSRFYVWNNFIFLSKKQFLNLNHRGLFDFKWFLFLDQNVMMSSQSEQTYIINFTKITNFINSIILLYFDPQSDG